MNIVCAPGADSDQPARPRIAKATKAPQADSEDSILHYENTPIQMCWKFHHQKLKVSI